MGQLNADMGNREADASRAGRGYDALRQERYGRKAGRLRVSRSELLGYAGVYWVFRARESQQHRAARKRPKLFSMKCGPVHVLRLHRGVKVLRDASGIVGKTSVSEFVPQAEAGMTFF